VVIASCGGARSMLIATVAAVELPDASVATAVMVCTGPAPSGTTATNSEPVTVAAAPSTTTVVMELSTMAPRTSMVAALVY
jgi:hypothetical protein